MVTMHSFDKHHWQPMLSCAVVNRCYRYVTYKAKEEQCVQCSTEHIGIMGMQRTDEHA
jgi:hypothetical protein